MDEHIDEALKQVRYKVMTDSSDLEAIYRLRYTCYRAQRSIAENESERMTDPFDETANCVHVAVLMNDEVLAALRLHLVSKLSHVSPTLEVFPEVLDRVENEETVLDPTRFVISPKVRGSRVPLHFLALGFLFLPRCSTVSTGLWRPCAASIPRSIGVILVTNQSWKRVFTQD